MTMRGKSCPRCLGAGYLELPASAGRGPSPTFELCPTCRNSGGVRAPLSTSSGQAQVPVDVTGRLGDRGEVPEGGVQKVRISKSAAFQKRMDARAELDRLAEREREIVGNGITKERALVRVLSTPIGKRLYAEYDAAAFDEANATLP